MVLVQFSDICRPAKDHKGYDSKPAMWPLWAGVLYIQDTLYVLLINGGNETVLYRQWFTI
jgi:hypothetical protein